MLKNTNQNLFGFDLQLMADPISPQENGSSTQVTSPKQSDPNTVINQGGSPNNNDVQNQEEKVQECGERACKHHLRGNGCV